MENEAVRVPEAWDLARIRTLLEGVRSAADLSTLTGLSRRHLDYHLQAARILNWLTWQGTPEPTSLGLRVIGTTPGSEEERTLFRQSVEGCDVVKEVVPELLAGISLDELTARLRDNPLTQLSQATARKRASTLLNWRRQVEPQRSSSNSNSETGISDTSSLKGTGRILIVHLSDLHIRADSENPALERLLKAGSALGARSELLAGIDGCLIALTGDLAFSGKAREYALLLEACRDLKACLEDRLRTTTTFVAVPGNHDCDFQAGDAVRETLIRNANPEVINDKYVDQCTFVQSNFRTFCDDLCGAGHRAEERAALTARWIKVGRATILVYLFNTAWMSELKEKQGAILFPHYTLDRLPADSPPSHLTISAFHHPYNWLEANNARRFRSEIERISDIILTGHEHVPQESQRLKTSGEHNAYLEGGVLQTHDRDESSFNALLVDIDTQQQTSFLFEWSPENEQYELSESRQPAPFLRNQSRFRNEFNLTSDATAFLTDPGDIYNHPRKSIVRLSDLFVYPDLKESPLFHPDSEEVREIRDPLDYVLKEEAVLISAPDLAGKTALAKTLFSDLHRRGMVPILIEGRTIRESETQAVHRLIDNAFRRHYGADNLERYRQLDPERRAIIVDDFHHSELKERGRGEFLLEIERFSRYCVVIGNDEIEISSVLGNEVTASKFSHCCIGALSRARQYELVSRWHCLGTTAADDMEAISKRIERTDRKISVLTGGNQLLPCYPAIILLCLQRLDSTVPVDNNIGSYGHLYESVLTRRLDSGVSSKIDIDTKQQVLAEFAYHLFKRNVSSLSEQEFDKFYREHCEKFSIPYDLTNTTKELLQSSIIHHKHGRFSFRYRCGYYFYSAKYLRDHLVEHET